MGEITKPILLDETGKEIADKLEEIRAAIAAGGGGGEGGTTNYNDLQNKPQIDGVTLSGNKTLSELGVQPAGSYANASHSHAQSDVNGLSDALAGKASANHNHDGVYQPAGSYAAASHTHAQSDVNGLSDALAGKQAKLGQDQQDFLDYIEYESDGAGRMYLKNNIKNLSNLSTGDVKANYGQADEVSLTDLALKVNSTTNMVVTFTDGTTATYKLMN